MKNIIFFAIICFGFTFTHNLNAQLPTSGLVGYYPFNANANDASGNCNNGLVVGASLTEDRFGRKNSAYFFNGTPDNYIKVPDNFSSQTNEYTYSVWCKLQTLPDFGSAYFVLSNGSSLHDQFIHAVNHSANYHGWNGSGYNIGSPPQYLLNTQKDVEINKWVHVVMTRSKNAMKLFINGNLETSDSTNYELQPDYGYPELFIGMRSNSTFPFYGSIDDVRIYNRVISQEEVTQLYMENVCFLNISVTDTLVINAHLTSLFPVNYKINIKAYPNPTLDHLIIDAGNISDLKDYSMRITNATGIEVFQSAIDKQFYDLDMNKWLGKGLYLLYLYDSNLKIVDVKKLILQ